MFLLLLLLLLLIIIIIIIIYNGNEKIVFQKQSISIDENIILGPEECPLMIQCKWQDMITYQFELKQNIDGYITVSYFCGF